MKMKYVIELIDSSLFEDKEFEYKLNLESDKDKIEKWAKTLVGYANGYGGYLLVGVNNDGVAVGTDHSSIDRYKNLILTTINRYIFPHINVIFNVFHIEEDKYFLSVYIDSVNEIVVYKSGDYNEKVYIREDGATVQASVSQILMLGKRRFGVDNHFLNEQYQKSNYSTFMKLSKKYRADGNEPTKEVLISKEIIHQDGRITEGLKMFSDSYSSDDSLVVCRLWNGYDKGEDEALDKKEFKGSLGHIFQQAMNFALRNSKSGFVKLRDGSRLDTLSYPEIVLREAIVNAIAHRDYSINGTQIDIDIFKDRMEIMSPGAWLLTNEPSQYSLDKVPSVRRNKIICNCFESIGLMEKSGSGFKKISNEYKKTNLRQPMLESTSDYFVITLYDLLFEGEEIDEAVSYRRYDEDILKFCLDHARTREEIQKHISYSSRSHFMTDILNPLISNNFIITTAPGKSRNKKYLTNKEKYIK